MLSTRLHIGWGRPRFLAGVLLATAFVALAFGIRASSALATCEAEVGFCTWTSPNYVGSAFQRVCLPFYGFWEDFNVEDKSAKNRCSGQSYRIGWTPEGGGQSSTNWKACLSPGGERPEPGRFNTYERVASC
jgi:hypothetical protein